MVFLGLCLNLAQAFLYSKNRQGFQSHQPPQYFVDDKACAWIAGFFLLYNSKDIDQYGAAIYPKKAAAIMILDKMLEQAVHTNWGERKENDPINVIAYCNFKCKILIDNELCFFAINVQICNDGSFHYSLDECRFKYKTSRITSGSPL